MAISPTLRRTTECPRPAPMWLPGAMTTVSTTRGVIRGTTGESCTTFLGVPYAAPPVGDLRWAPPAPVPAWEGVLDATHPGPAAWQPTGGPMDGLVPGMGSSDQGDDCLSLNVWTPAADGERRPVMVWIHGGAYSLGAGSLGVYDGTRLAAATDTVVVTINYRLGALGFMVLDDPSAAPNVGLLDQVAALEWVRDDIAAFGGDPDRVTIFGESAGRRLRAVAAVDARAPPDCSTGPSPRAAPPTCCSTAPVPAR